MPTFFAFCDSWSAACDALDDWLTPMAAPMAAAAP